MVPPEVVIFSSEPDVAAAALEREPDAPYYETVAIANRTIAEVEARIEAEEQEAMRQAVQVVEDDKAKAEAADLEARRKAAEDAAAERAAKELAAAKEAEEIAKTAAAAAAAAADAEDFADEEDGTHLDDYLTAVDGDNSAGPGGNTASRDHAGG